MVNRIVMGAIIAGVAGFGVVAAQHTGQHQSPAHETRTDHSICGAHHAVAAQPAAQPHAAPAGAVAQHHGVAAQHHAAAAPQHHAPTAAPAPFAALAAELKLTSKQTADIDKLANEACAAMVKYHEQILAVLTPEQRAKMQELHGGGHAASDLAAFFRKLHGGR